jgi:TPR repeat protein
LSRENDRIDGLYNSGKEKEAIAAWIKLASTGDVEAMTNLGAVYWEEIENFPESIKWFKKAKDLGDKEAIYYIAFPYIEIGDYEMAKESFQEAIAAGFQNAVLGLADVLINFLDRAEEAEKLLRFHAEQGHERAKVWLVDIYLSRGDMELSQRVIADLKLHGSAEAITSLLTTLRKHDDTSQVFEVLRLAAALGDTSAHQELLLELEKAGDRKILEKHLSQIVLGSTKNAIYSLAISLVQGSWFYYSPFLQSAEYLFTHLAKRGHKHSYLRLGEVILRTKDSDRKQEALSWLVKAAENGSRPAQVKVVLLASELGKTEVFEKWFESALALGLPGQNARLGVELAKKKQQAAALRAFEYEFENGSKLYAGNYRLSLLRSGRLEEAEKVRLFIDRETL